MYKKYNSNIEKSISVIKLILSNFKNNVCDFHKIFKILYFAEKKHLSLYGRSIIEDRYIAMKDGPVPSGIYDIVKILRGDSIFTSEVDFSKHFKVNGSYHLQLVDSAFDMDVFSESEIECISSSIEENRFLDFRMLSDKAHDSAYNSAERDDVINIFEIAKAGGANEELLNYISLTTENKRLEIS
ncbi:MAG: Panacea domain-containing protein [Segetibacter sp.]